MRRGFCLFLVVCLASGTLGFADEGELRQQIRQWVQQLGRESFLVRQRAESQLIRTGIRAYPELQRAKKSSDVEVVRRAEYVLNQIEQAFLNTESREVAYCVQLYMLSSDPAYKARMIWHLADPFPTPHIEPGLAETGFDRGEGLQTLCRLLRFEENESLRLEAAKTLIASPPISPILRQKWYQFIQDNTFEGNDDRVLQCVAQYAKLWCDLEEADKKTTPELQERVRQVSAETLRLLDKLENSIPVGGKIDLLLHYAVAELQDAAGLSQDRDNIVLAALNLQPETTDALEPTQPVGLDDNRPMFAHWYVGWSLMQRFRLHWATAHFQKVIETGDLVLQVRACAAAAEAAIDLEDYPAAMAFFDKQIELLKSPDYTRRNNDSARNVIRTQRRKAYCSAAKAAAEEDWEKVQEAIKQGWEISDVPLESDDMDLVILAHRLCQQKFDVGLEFRDKMELSLKQLWRNIELNYSRNNPAIPEERLTKIVNMSNSAAWLLANTEGDYRSALTLVEAALRIKPDDAKILDTLAHVYALGGKVGEAIRTQERVVRMAPEVTVFRQALERFQQAKTEERE